MDLVLGEAAQVAQVEGVPTVKKAVPGCVCLCVCVCVYNTTQYRETSTPGGFLGKLALWLVFEASRSAGQVTALGRTALAWLRVRASLGVWQPSLCALVPQSCGRGQLCRWAPGGWQDKRCRKVSAGATQGAPEVALVSMCRL